MCVYHNFILEQRSNLKNREMSREIIKKLNRMKKFKIFAIACIVVVTASASLTNIKNESSSLPETEQIRIERTCRDCNGKGYRFITKQCSCLKNPNCSKCGGAGVIKTKYRCNTCNGTGKVRVK